MHSQRWFAAVAILGSAIVGVIAYNIGLSQGAAHAAAASGALPPYPYGLYRPWGFGFGFPILFFVFFWLIVSRAFFWGGPWRRRWYHYRGEVPPSFDEWHRRAHERMSEKQV